MFEEIEKAEDGDVVLAPGHHSVEFVSFAWDVADDE